MKLTVIGSSSKGNGYLLDNGGEALIIEAGTPLLSVKEALDYQLIRVRGVLVTHEHGDHAKHVREYLRARLHTYATGGTIDSMIDGYKIPDLEASMLHRLSYNQAVKIGGFGVIPFKTYHDCSEPCGFLIHHAAMGTLLFATDTYMLHNRFRGLNHVLIEANYCDDIAEGNLVDGVISEFHFHRLFKSHLSLYNCERFLRANDLREVRGIVLLHLSSANADPAEFKRAIEEGFGKVTHIARAGLEIDLSL